MNLYDRGKQLSRVVTATIGVLAVIVASALGLHSWADSATTASASTGTGASSSTGSSVSSSSDATDSSGYDSAVTSPVLPATGGFSHARSNGS
ncbi:hypothetical protein [Cryobacterium sp. PH29-G1]|uniref:hypothetical protein n=1 Tax=Cryobacterium sp. PH29-G1 TaxID=3046211 RepID=UPI0024BB3A9A|nr:hypothetical protein [Cryobacterium sp. PH29-G1]MDJ0349367.1 hypothetical protein [Cryobacterium sp. PH29-G1]